MAPGCEGPCLLSPSLPIPGLPTCSSSSAELTRCCPGSYTWASICLLPTVHGRSWTSLVVQQVKNLPATQETWVQSVGLKIPWRRKWQPTPVFLPEKSHGQKNLESYSPWGCKSVTTDFKDTTERLSTCTMEEGIFSAVELHGRVERRMERKKSVCYSFYLKIMIKNALYKTKKYFKYKA